MKRSFVVAFAILLSGGLGLTACSKTAPVAGGGTPLSMTSVPRASSTPSVVAPTATTSSAPVTVDAESSQAPVQLSETGAAETVDATPTGSQALALKITQVTPPAALPQWKEGVNYTTLVPAQSTNALPGQVEVAEVFWYGCPHCYALDPYLETWRKQGKADYVSFARVPVMWGAIHRIHARLFYTAELLGKLDEFHSLIFREIHEAKNPLSSAEQIEAFFIAHGVAQADFQKAFSSFAVEASLKRAEALGLRYRIESVPTIIVNGKYVTDVGMAGGPQQLVALINELASREKGT